MSLMKFLDDKQKRNKRNKPEVTTELADEIIQYTDLIVDFVMKEFAVTLFKSRDMENTPSDEYRTPVEDFTTLSNFDNKSLKTISPIDGPDTNQKLIHFNVKQLEMSMVQRTYDMKVILK